jgi:hypothetical protein
MDLELLQMRQWRLLLGLSPTLFKVDRLFTELRRGSVLTPVQLALEQLSSLHRLPPPDLTSPNHRLSAAGLERSPATTDPTPRSPLSRGWIGGSEDRADLLRGGITTSVTVRELDLRLIEEMNNAGGKRSVAVMKIGVVTRRSDVVMKSGDRRIKSVSALRNAEDLMSVVVLTMSGNVKRLASPSVSRVNVPWRKDLARKMICVLVIDGRIALRWFLELPPTPTPPDLLM